MPCRPSFAFLVLLAFTVGCAVASPHANMKATTKKHNAMELLRGNPVAAVDLREADAAWQKLSKAIATALADRDLTEGATVAELETMFATLKPGENVNGWVNPYAKDDPRSLLKQYQFASFHDDSQFIMDVWSRQTGKDYTVAGVAARDAITKPLTEWTIAGPSERQSLESLEKVKVWVEAFGDVIADYREDRDGHSQALMKSAIIILPNGSKIRAVPGMPHTVRGLTSSVALTEGDFFEKPKETMRALFGSIANEEKGRKTVRIITTPNGKDGMTWKEFGKPDSLYTKRLVTIWRAVCLGIKQNPVTLMKALDDPEGWAQEFLCEWLDGSNVLLPYELIQSCESIEASEHDTPEALKASPLRKVAGIDFGRVSDPTVMSLALNGMGINIVRNITKLKGMSTPDQVTTLKPYLDLCDRICVDYTGPGIGFGDELVKLYGEHKPESHQFGKVELCTFTLPLKRELFPALRVAFEQRNLRVPVSSWFREDLHAMAQVITNGQYNYKAPRSDEGHSDGCTSLALMVRAGSGASTSGARSVIATHQGTARGGVINALRNLNPFGRRA